MSQGEVWEWVEAVRIELCGFEGLPMPENLLQGSLLEIQVGGPVNRRDLIEAIESGIQPRPFVLDERFSHFSWGAETTSLLLIVSVALQDLGALIEVVQAMARKFGKRRRFTGEDVLYLAKRVLSDALNVSESQVAIEAVEELAAKKHRAMAVVGDRDRFEVTVEAGGNVGFRRLDSQSDTDRN